MRRIVCTFALLVYLLLPVSSVAREIICLEYWTYFTKFKGDNVVYSNVDIELKEVVCLDKYDNIYPVQFQPHQFTIPNDPELVRIRIMFKNNLRDYDAQTVCLDLSPP